MIFVGTAVRVFLRAEGHLRHIQIRLQNNRGIRLEGYQDLERSQPGPRDDASPLHPFRAHLDDGAGIRL
jgi:hypothetical protein